MKIFITGASGFLGKFLSRALQERGDTVINPSSRVCDLQYPVSLEQFQSERFDQIYHLAAWTQAGDFCLKHPGEQWLINQKINTNILDWWGKKQPQAKLIAIGTSCSYDPGSRLKEEEYLSGTPIDSLFTYAMTKRMLLTGLIALQKQFGLEYLYVIPSTLYGADYHDDGRQMHFIFDVVRKIVRAHLYDEPVILWGDGHQKRELIHVADFIDALLQLVKIEKNTWINIGGGEGYSIRHFAKIICKIVGYSPDKIHYDLTKYVGAKSKVLNVQKLHEILPSFSPRPLNEGLQEVVQWFMEKNLQCKAALHL